MPTIQQNSSQTITLNAGALLRFLATGGGVAVMGPGPGANAAFALGATEVAIGPFTDVRTIYANATTGPLVFAIDSAQSGGSQAATVQRNSGGAATNGGRLIRYRPRIALLGDSIMGQTTDYGSKRNANGAVSWMLARLGQPWYLPTTHNFAVAGTTVDVMLANQLPALLSAHGGAPISRCFISAGTNDTNAGRPMSAIRDDLMRLFETLLDAGITPVHHGILPRGLDGAMTNAKRQNLQLNEWLQWYAYTAGGLEFIDCGLTVADNSSAFGNALAALTDGSRLHPLDNGAFFMGQRMASYYQAKGIAPAVRFASSQADQFDATNNPTGVIFDNPNPLLQGGTTAPTDMTTSGGTWSMVTQTLPNGQTKPMAQCTLAASTAHFLYDDALGPASAQWTGARIATGDLVYAVAEIELVNCVSIKAVELRLAENNGAGALTLGDLAEASGATFATGSSLTLFTMTPPVRVRAYAGSGQPSVFVQQRIVTGAGETGSARIKGFELRKWTPEV